MRIFLASVVIAAACGSPKQRSRTAKPRSYPAPLYAGLFVEGARYTYAVEGTSEHWGDEDPRADASGKIRERFAGTMTCTVSEVAVLPSAVAARFECGGPGTVALVGDGPAGIYVATADGLWSVPEMPRVAPTTAKDRLFTWPPVEGTTEERDPQRPEWVTTVTVSRDSVGGWCRYFTFISGDDGDAELCIRDGIVVGGAASSSGAASHAMTYALVKP